MKIDKAMQDRADKYSKKIKKQILAAVSDLDVCKQCDKLGAPGSGKANCAKICPFWKAFVKLYDAVDAC